MRVLGRNGVSVVQMAVVLAVVAFVAITTVELLGTSTSNALEDTAADVADPASLAARFAADGSHRSQSPNAGGDQGSGDSSGGSGGGDSGAGGGSDGSSGGDSGSGSGGGLCP